jgi:hypothetical protein
LVEAEFRFGPNPAQCWSVRRPDWDSSNAEIKKWSQLQDKTNWIKTHTRTNGVDLAVGAATGWCEEEWGQSDPCLATGNKYCFGVIQLQFRFIASCMGPQNPIPSMLIVLGWVTVQVWSEPGKMLALGEA